MELLCHHRNKDAYYLIFKYAFMLTFRNAPVIGKIMPATFP